MRSSLNSAQANSSSAKKGFLLSDAAVSLFIVSMLAALILSVVRLRVLDRELIRRTAEENDEAMAEVFRGCERCEADE